MQGRGPSNIILASLFASLMFAGLHNQSTLLTKLEVTQTVFLAYKHLSSSTVLRNSLADETSGGFHQRKEKPYVLIEGESGFWRALIRAPEHWRFSLPPCSLRVMGEWLSWETSSKISRQIGTNLHLNGFLEWVWLVLTAIVMQSWAKYNARLHRTRHFQTLRDQLVFKLNGIVVLVHQLPTWNRFYLRKHPSSICRMPNIARRFEFSINRCWKRTSY